MGVRCDTRRHRHGVPWNLGRDRRSRSSPRMHFARTNCIQRGGPRARTDRWAARSRRRRSPRSAFSLGFLARFLSFIHSLFCAFFLCFSCLLLSPSLFSRPPMLPLLSLLSPTVSSKLKCPSPPRTPVPLRASLCQSLTPFSTGTAPFLCIR